jgi:hypothetical protein
MKSSGIEDVQNDEGKGMTLVTREKDRKGAPSNLVRS